MKKLTCFAFVLLCFLCKIDAQTERNQPLKSASSLLSLSKEALAANIKTKGYVYTNQQSNFLTYTKSTRISSYDFTYSVSKQKVTGISWDEYIGHIDDISGELTSLGFKMFVENSFGERQVRGYQNLSRNFLVTIMTKGSYFTVVVGPKNPSKPLVFNSQTKSSENLQNSTRVVKIHFSPKTTESRIFAKPSTKVLHKDWSDGEIGLGWGFEAVKEIKTSEGTFYMGTVLSSRGSAQPNGPYYILLEEWQPIG